MHKRSKAPAAPGANGVHTPPADAAPRPAAADLPVWHMPAAPALIDPRHVFTVDTLRATLGLAKGCVPREIRLRRLVAHKRAGRYFILGDDVIAWLRSGPARRSRDSGTDGREAG